MIKIGTKLVISILVFILTLGVLATTTYAWLAKATETNISDISLTAGTGPDLEISLGSLGNQEIDSLDKLSWSSTISSEEIMSAIGDELLFYPVTTYDGKNFRSSSSAYHLDDIIINNGDTNYENKSYIKIPMYFRASKIATPLEELMGVGVFLSDYASNVNFNEASSAKGSFITSQGVNAYSDNEYIDSFGNLIYPGLSLGSVYAREAMRISMVQVGNISLNNDEQIDDYLEAKVFDLSNNPQNGHVSSVENKTWGFVSYYQAKTGILLTSFPETIPNTISGKDFTYFDLRGYPINDNSKVVTLHKEIINGITYFVAKCYLYIWLEGWDVDCYDVLINDHIYSQFMFKLGYGPEKN